MGLLVGLVGLLLYLKSRAKSLLAYQQWAVHLVGGSKPALPGEVEITYQGIKVPRLTRTTIVLWNAGTVTIRGSEAVAADPLRLVFALNTQVLRVRIVDVTRPMIGFQGSVNPAAASEVLLAFDYLDPRDGASIEILHTGDQRYPHVMGTIIGLPKGLRDWGRILPDTPSFVGLPLRRIFRVMLWVGIFLGVGFSAFGLLPIMATGTIPMWAGVLFGAVYAGIFAVWLSITRRRFPRRVSSEELA